MNQNYPNAQNPRQGNKERPRARPFTFIVGAIAAVFIVTGAVTGGFGGALVMAGVVAMFTGIYVVITGRPSWIGLRGRKAGGITLAVGLIVTMAGGALLPPTEEPVTTAADSTEVLATSSPTREPAQTKAPAASKTKTPAPQPTTTPPTPTESAPSAPARSSTSRSAEEKSGAQETAKASKLWPVLRVVDGDTVHVGYRGEDASVRVIGIDTPEVVHPSVAEECGGPIASKNAVQLLEGRMVRLVFDPSQGRTDKYGRMLAYIELPGLGDYGKIMLERGLAAEYTYDTPYKRRPVYLKAEAQARAGGSGTWGTCGGFDTPLHSPTPEPQPPVQQSPVQQQPPQPPMGTCAPGYSPCLPPYPPDIDCADAGGPVTVTGSDPHGLDRDGDGLACEG
ncbi:thermonuclease family protein [Arthrobacter pigmenti]